MKRRLKITAKFVVVMMFMTIVCTVFWDSVVNRDLYDCTDAVGWDYLRPGDWVHDFDGRAVMTVPHVVHGRSMSEPDTIKQGWSVEKLWTLWFCFLVTSLAMSGWLARKKWLPGFASAEDALNPPPAPVSPSTR